MMSLTRTCRCRAALFCAVAGGGLLPLLGCNTGGGMPQMLEPTKPHMDGEREAGGPPAVKVGAGPVTPPDPEWKTPRRVSPAEKR